MAVNKEALSLVIGTSHDFEKRRRFESIALTYFYTYMTFFAATTRRGATVAKDWGGES